MGVIKINYSGLRPITYSGGITTTRQLMRELKDMEDNFITVIVGDREYIIDRIKSVRTFLCAHLLFLRSVIYFCHSDVTSDFFYSTANYSVNKAVE